MALLEATLRSATIYSFVAGATSTSVALEGGGGGGGNGGALARGGGGGGGAYASTPDVPTTPGTVYPIRVGKGGTATTAGESSTFGGSTVVAAGGSPGANQSGLGAGAGGAGGTTAASTGTTRTAGGAGASGGDGGQGAPPLGGTGNTIGDGGAGGQILSGAGQPGQAGLAVISYDTGTPAISHGAIASRLATLNRTSAADIVHSAAFQRVASLLRTLSATTAHVSVRYGLLIILLPRTATIAHAAAITRKLVRLARTSSIAHAATATRQTILERLGAVTHGAFFARAVTVRRAFLAAVTHKRRTLVTLDAENVPGGEGAVTQVFRSLFVFDD